MKIKLLCLVFFYFFFTSFSHAFEFNYYGDAKVFFENINVDQSNPVACAITGRVRNLESRPLKGIVQIRFLDYKGDIIKFARTGVAGFDILESNQAGPFEYWTEKENCTRSATIEYIFKEW